MNCCHEHKTSTKRGISLKESLQDRELLFALTCGLLLLINRVLVWTDATPEDSLFVFSLLPMAYFFGGYDASREVISALRQKRFNIHLLMLIAAAGAATIDAWVEGALLLFLFSLGHSLEHVAMQRARHAIHSLADLAPDIAHKKIDGNFEEVPVEQLGKGDIVQVKPGERFPADGFVTAGHSSVNQASVTGESMPVDKSPADRSKENFINEQTRIFAGTINGDGVLEVEVTATAEESTLGKVVKMIREAEKQRSPTQQFAIRFERIFVPVILVMVTLISFAWLVIDEPFADSFYRAMVVLVGASPCALAISTPSAVLSGIARSARLGILVKGGRPLELMGMVKAIAFDKTGTLTRGEPRITDIIPLNGFSENDLLGTAVAVEQLSDHPLAKAIVRDAKTKLGSGFQIPVAADGENLTGSGFKACINGEEAGVGKPSVIEDLGEDAELDQKLEELRSAGRTTVIVYRDGTVLGIIGMMDTLRDNAQDVIQKLRNLGISPLIMISGDHQIVAEATGKQAGTNESYGGLLPDEKVDVIKKMTQKYGQVAMVGDGVNDAPAMAASGLGIAMGAAGSDVALETAEIALMADDLSKLPQAAALSRGTRKIIKQNLFISLGMIAILVPAALFGLANLTIAVILHEGSTLAVVLNALRLLRWKV